MENEFDFNALIGKKFKFYGVCDNKFKLNDTIYEAIEDESDGYRSMLECVITSTPGDGIFFQTSIARVEIVEYDDGINDGYKLVDVKDGHEWLRFGTDNSDDYYPWFVFEYNPKPPK